MLYFFLASNRVSFIKIPLQITEATMNKTTLITGTTAAILAFVIVGLVKLKSKKGTSNE